MALPDLITKFLRKEVETPFSKGIAYRTFKELNIAAAGTYVIKIVVPKNVILSGLQIQIASGNLKVETIVGGTEGGSFSESLPRISMNTRTDAPTVVAGVLLTAGGTQTGGTVIDVITVKTDANTSRGTSVGGVDNEQRGVGPNTYYWKFTSSGTDPVVGTFKAHWEEA